MGIDSSLLVWWPKLIYLFERTAGVVEDRCDHYLQGMLAPKILYDNLGSTSIYGYQVKVITQYRRGSSSKVRYAWCTFIRSEEINARVSMA
ncbi:25604_t:CDS:2 [Gigaspora rosea]|nr:25604_t:CDS:2 [Gigaspora rosea]